MIKILNNPKTDNYVKLKEIILHKNFPWYYSGNSTKDFRKKEGHSNVFLFGHTFLARPEEQNYSQPISQYFDLAKTVVNEILTYNFVMSPADYFLLRLNANCTLPSHGHQYCVPHKDHEFKHVNFITYMTDSGGSTYVEGEEHQPQEDQTIIFEGEHYMKLPERYRRIVLVATLFTWGD
tara:strand:- start:44 stop:580 length:537 start_codon:yes stop_codon:yes gene_type:complete